MKKKVAIIPLRNGSKGLPGKNIQEFCGLPLYYWTVLQALEFADRCIVTTDIEDILSGKLPIPEEVQLRKRPSELASDSAKMESVIQDVLAGTEYKDTIILLLQATSPLRANEDIQNSIDLFLRDDFQIVFTVSKSDPSLLKNGFMNGNEFKSVSDYGYLFQNRQELPQTFRPNGAVYIFNSKDFIKYNGFNFSNFGSVLMPHERSLDIDTKEDFLKAEEIYSKYKKNLDVDKIVNDESVHE